MFKLKIIILCIACAVFGCLITLTLNDIDIYNAFIKNGKKNKRTRQELDWKHPFLAEDGYMEVDLDEIIESLKKNPIAAAAVYNGRKVIFKGTASVDARGNLDVKGMQQESKGYSYYIYAAHCWTNQDRALLDTVKLIDNNARTIVYIKGTISGVFDNKITVDVKELACFGQGAHIY